MKLVKAAVNVTSISVGAGVGGAIGYALSERHSIENIPKERVVRIDKVPQYDESKTVEKPLEYTGPGLIVDYNFKPNVENVPTPQTTKKDVEHKIQANETTWGITLENYPDLETDPQVAVQTNKVADYQPNIKAIPSITKDTKSVIDGVVVNKSDGIRGDEIPAGGTLILPDVPSTVLVNVPTVTGTKLTYNVREFLGVKEIPVKESYMEPHQFTAYDLNFALMGALVGAGVITSIYGLGKGVRRLFSNGRGERIAEAGVVITTFGTISHEVYRLAGVLSDPDKVNQALRNLEQVLNYVPKFL